MADYSKLLLVPFNLFFVIPCIIIMLIGTNAKHYYSGFDVLLNNSYFYFSDFIIVIGVAIFIIAAFGYYKALKANAWMTKTFSILVIMVFFLEILVGISGVVLKYKTAELLENNLNQTINRYGNDSEVTVTWDAVQNEMKCCGVTNSSDWYYTKVSINDTLPVSCCPIPPGTMHGFNCTSSLAYHEGCITMFGDYIRSTLSATEIVGGALAIVQVVGIFALCYFQRELRSDYESI